MLTEMGFTPPTAVVSQKGGLSSEQLANIATDKIIFVNKNSLPKVLFDQAVAFKSSINRIIYEALRVGRRSALSDCIYEAEQLGLSDLAKALRARIDNGNY